MDRDTASPVWPSAAPPDAPPGQVWPLEHVSQLPRVRAQLRRHLVESVGDPDSPRAAELVDRVVLAFDEMASNALRHGGAGVVARVAPHERSWLVEVCDSAAVSPPTPAIGRDPSQGGLGLYLIAEMSTAHGWHTVGGSKSVWALLPR
ncbi:ATP-binding protein [Klenkia taihuensis]|uniref:Histidine kinase-like ATPase domain-containing protein n=1 Tax=Klenkia taihuensis TaxID=1225127 RepID=A0A1I1GEK2_9ACTN|nr:ATP-binding protein [Klenkia taihuensis]GHE09799.1 ATP-binding protein [Klenkia taihuensis]SFC09712.1 Histidine kinase-like ATPase domain-containing protein [Klenkia taihuensis]